MFENPKYITRGVQSEIPDALMLLMWQMIAAMQTSQKDYLQVFILTKTPTGTAHRPRSRNSRRTGTNSMCRVTMRVDAKVYRH